MLRRNAAAYQAHGNPTGHEPACCEHRPFASKPAAGQLRRENEVAILVETARSHDVATASLLPSRQAAWQAGGVLIALAAAAALLEPLGFRLTTLLFIAGLLFALGARSPSAILLTALAGSFGVFHVFFYWLKVPLPIGALGL
jgi:hypothetical protein